MFSAELEWISDAELRVDGTTYDVLCETASPTGQLLLYKPREMVEAYSSIAAEFAGSNIVELGIFRGGSTAFFAQVLRPRQLIAFDLSTARVRILDEFLVDHPDLSGSVQLHYGVDQSDQETLAELVTSDLGDEPIDLVIDDASHWYGPPVASFGVLFPRLRPGGLYVIEDWQPPLSFAEHFFDMLADRPSADSVALEGSIAEGLLEPRSVNARYFTEWFVRAVVDPGSPRHDRMREWYSAILTDNDPACRNIREHFQPRVEAGWSGLEPVASLVTMAAELVLSMASRQPGIAGVSVNPYWIEVHRSDEPLDPDLFDYPTFTDDPMTVLHPRSFSAPTSD